MTWKIPKQGDFIERILNAIPLPIFVVDEDVRIFWSNQSASPLLDAAPDSVFLRRCGEVFHCRHAMESTAGCGHTKFCPDCPIRNSVQQSIHGQRVVRVRNKMTLLGPDKAIEMHLLVTTAPFPDQDESLVLLILEDISELIKLKSIVPICAYCKKIRDDEDYWQSVEEYFRLHLSLDFSHGVCPECAQKNFPNFDE
jgi:PAS domain-containing protein